MEASGVRPTDVSGTDAQKKHLKMTRTARGAARDDTGTDDGAAPHCATPASATRPPARDEEHGEGTYMKRTRERERETERERTRGRRRARPRDRCR